MVFVSKADLLCWLRSVTSFHFTEHRVSLFCVYQGLIIFWRMYYSLDILIDINECEEDHNICDTTSSMCMNLPGSYHCSCLPGYIKQDGVCKGKGTSQSSNSLLKILIHLSNRVCLPKTTVIFSTYQHKEHFC